MSSGNSDKFCYYYYITCGNDQLCRKSILYFTGWGAGCHANRYRGWNIFIYCRINDQCSDGCDYSRFEYCGNLYSYLYHGSRRWMCSTDGDYFSNNNNAAGSYI